MVRETDPPDAGPRGPEDARRMPLPTARQHQALAFIADHIRRVECPPTLREIGDHMAIRSTNAVADHLEALETKGYLENRPGLSRSRKLTDKAREYLASKATT
jgi:SOS-response transcriptional repressor LexA